MDRFDPHRCGIPGLLVLALAALLPAEASASTLYVGHDTQGVTLQLMIDEAEDGDVLVFESGHYQANLEFLDKNLVLRGKSEGGEVVLDGGQQGPVVTSFDSELTIEGVTIRGGQALRGGGIHIEGGGLVLRGVRVLGNQGELGGGGLYGDGATIDIEGCTFEANQASKGGGALIHQSPTLRVSQSIFYRNRGQHGAALRVEELGGHIDHSLFLENGRDGNGQGVLGETSLFLDVGRGHGAVVEHNTFLRNGCCHIAMNRGFGVEIRDNVFTEGAGFGVLLVSNREQGNPGEGQPDIHHNAFFENTFAPFTVRDRDGESVPRDIDGSRGNIGDDPLLKDASSGSVPTLDAIYPEANSPLIDAGSPRPTNQDMDGTRGDIGHRPASMGSPPS